MSGKSWRGRALWVLAYSLPVLVLAIFVFFSFAEVSVPYWPGDETLELDDHLHSVESFPLSYSDGAQVGRRIPGFTLELLQGRVVTSDELVAEGKPTFLFFWATT